MGTTCEGAAWKIKCLKPSKKGSNLLAGLELEETYRVLCRPTGLPFLLARGSGQGRDNSGDSPDSQAGSSQDNRIKKEENPMCLCFWG